MAMILSVEWSECEVAVLSVKATGNGRKLVKVLPNLPILSR